MKVLVYGSLLMGSVVRSLVEDCGHEFAGFIDDINPGPEVLGGFEAVCASHPPASFACVNAIGYRDLATRRKVSERIRAAGYQTPILIHPRAYLASSVTAGNGALVMATASIDHRVTLGEDVVVWPAATVSHDSTIGGNTFLSPAAIICGDCRIGRDCFIGAGAVVVSYCDVPDSTFVKALTRYVSPAARARWQ
jgi:sugar O-acyltransferase (sialic acid O-acetyltransferase NeuD family)